MNKIIEVIQSRDKFDRVFDIDVVSEYEYDNDSNNNEEGKSYEENDGF